VHEIAVLADQRRRAGHAFTSDALVEWHRHNLPALTERIGSRLRKHGEDGHQPWPAKGRYTRNTAEISRRTRQDSFAAEIGALRPPEAEGGSSGTGDEGTPIDLPQERHSQTGCGSDRLSQAALATTW